MQTYDIGGFFSNIFAHLGIMFFGSIYVAVPEYIGNNIYILCGSIKRRSERATQFMRRNILRSNRFTVFFHKIFKGICHMENEEDGYGLHKYMGIISVFSRD